MRPTQLTVDGKYFKIKKLMRLQQRNRNWSNDSL